MDNIVYLLICYTEHIIVEVSVCIYYHHLYRIIDVVPILGFLIYRNNLWFMVFKIFRVGIVILDFLFDMFDFIMCNEENFSIDDVVSIGILPVYEHFENILKVIYMDKIYIIYDNNEVVVLIYRYDIYHKICKMNWSKRKDIDDISSMLTNIFQV